MNCGGCGLACDTCTNGRCIVVLASGQAHPGPIAVTSTDVIWANSPTGDDPEASIAKVPIRGGTIETLAITGRDALSLAVDSGYAYWTTESSATLDPPTEIADGTVVKMSLQGGAPLILASNQLEPSFVAVNAGTVYWIANGVMSVPTTGGAPTVFAPDGAYALTLSAGEAYWADSDGMGGVILKKKELAAGAPEITLTTDVELGNVLRLAASSTDLYWTYQRYGGGLVQKVALVGGAPVTVYEAADDLFDYAVVVDGNDLYWGSQLAPPALGRILKVPLAGGIPVALSPAPPETRFMVIDATSVYFTDIENGKVIKVTPK